MPTDGFGKFAQSMAVQATPCITPAGFGELRLRARSYGVWCGRVQATSQGSWGIYLASHHPVGRTKQSPNQHKVLPPA